MEAGEIPADRRSDGSSSGSDGDDEGGDGAGGPSGRKRKLSPAAGASRDTPPGSRQRAQGGGGGGGSGGGSRPPSRGPLAAPVASRFPRADTTPGGSGGGGGGSRPPSRGPAAGAGGSLPPQSMLSRVIDDVAGLKQLQAEMDYDSDAPAAHKSSPSVSGEHTLPCQPSLPPSPVCQVDPSLVNPLLPPPHAPPTHLPSLLSLCLIQAFSTSSQASY